MFQRSFHITHSCSFMNNKLWQTASMFYGVRVWVPRRKTWLSFLLLHAGWKLLRPVLGGDPRPLKFQLFLDVQSFALFKKCRILVVLCQAFLQGWVLLSTLKYHEEAGIFAAVVKGFNSVRTSLLGFLPHHLGDQDILLHMS